MLSNYVGVASFVTSQPSQCAILVEGVGALEWVWRPDRTDCRTSWGNGTSPCQGRQLSLHVQCGGSDVCLRLYRFFVEAVRVLEENVGTAGVFRKAGSVTRQKTIKVS